MGVAIEDMSDPCHDGNVLNFDCINVDILVVILYVILQDVAI